MSIFYRSLSAGLLLAQAELYILVHTGVVRGQVATHHKSTRFRQVPYSLKLLSIRRL
jgi:hypothetical protein